jgi:hypothetical protein
MTAVEKALDEIKIAASHLNDSNLVGARQVLFDARKELRAAKLDLRSKKLTKEVLDHFIRAIDLRLKDRVEDAEKERSKAVKLKAKILRAAADESRRAG